jgi:hypothetical protein
MELFDQRLSLLVAARLQDITGWRREYAARERTDGLSRSGATGADTTSRSETHRHVERDYRVGCPCRPPYAEPDDIPEYFKAQTLAVLLITQNGCDPARPTAVSSNRANPFQLRRHVDSLTRGMRGRLPHTGCGETLDSR